MSSCCCGCELDFGRPRPGKLGDRPPAAVTGPIFTLFAAAQRAPVGLTRPEDPRWLAPQLPLWRLATAFERCPLIARLSRSCGPGPTGEGGGRVPRILDAYYYGVCCAGPFHARTRLPRLGRPSRWCGVACPPSVVAVPSPARDFG